MKRFFFLIYFKKFEVVLVTYFFLVLVNNLDLIKCQAQCGHPPIPMNAKMSLSSAKLNPGTFANYRCDEGYVTFGNTELKCSSSGKWIGELPFCGVNVAFRKPANQSSTARGGTSLNANDGRFSTNHDAEKCSETLKEVSPWWQVDLLRPYSIKNIRITTRGCCGHQPLQDLEIRVGNSSSDLQRNPLCAWFPGTVEEGITKNFSCARSLVGQYVFIQLVGVEGSLSLCEVEVFTPDEFSVDRCAPKEAPEEIQLAAFARTCYEFAIFRGNSFQEAQNYCKRHNGDLVHGMSQGQTQFLTTELERRKPTLKTQLVWIGAQKEPGITSRTWKWVNGEVIQRPSWGKDQPNNYNGEQNCIVLDGGRNWLWNDVGCNLDYLNWICQHVPSSCGSPDKLINTTINGTDYSLGSSIEYLCPEGHFLLGNSKRFCGENGFWTGMAPSCKFIDCGPLTDPPHGIVTIKNNRTTFGAKAMYSCHENYTLIGHEFRECDSNSKWTNSSPECLLDWCPNPPEIHGGIVKITGQRAGARATYSCADGYVIFGDSVLSCDLGGKWSGKIPNCKYVDCGTPKKIEFGSSELRNSSTTVGSIVEYFCEEDYWLNGSKVSQCTKDGKWSEGAPSCELITCEEPEIARDSYVEGFDFNVNSQINYFCEPGHLLQGNSTRFCQRNGEWSGETPNCEYIDCGKVPTLLYGEVQYENGTTYLGSHLHYSCAKNYKLNGSVERSCLPEGRWSGSSARCDEIRCPEPILPKHGIVSVTGNDRIYGRTLIRTAESDKGVSYRIGALSKFQCGRGYKIVGDSLSTCEENGKWSGSVPECIFVDCKEPESILYGEVSLATNATYYGALALYSCAENYELEGLKRRLCQENGTWSSETPRCREIQCKEPDTFPGVSFSLSSLSVGGLAKYSCPRGHLIQGNTTRTCQKKGIWSGKPPSCNAVDCGDPEDIENGRVIVMNGTIYNSAIEYHCLPTFERIGPFLRKCLETGQWSGDQPKCQIIIEQPQEDSNLGTSIGIGAGIVVFLLVLLGMIYWKLRKPVAVKNKENIEGAERKEERNAAVMSYATLADRTDPIGQSNIYENMYDDPYGGESETYEPEPVSPPKNGTVVTINGVAVR